ncbi:DUF4344 domain-containing metallopeptidase [Pseudoxanthomonas sp. 10H]|uniref:DUF4344 domain-containing metallopeptidase n=1 Tax=Pseudoxanthomonas sp. 10H TaxID=3242729 RepID=UPI00355850D3
MASAPRINALIFALAMAVVGCASASSPAAARDGRGASPPDATQALPRSVVQPSKTARTGGPAFQFAYTPPQSRELRDIYRRVVEADLWRQLPEVQAIDGMFMLPRPLRFVTAECGEFGAFYHPEDTEVVLCYETLRTLYEQGRSHQQALGLGDDHPLRYLRANVRFIVLHETGHALVDLLDLPVTGRQEDAVDQLAAILMLRFAGLDETPEQVIGNLRLAANWMLSRSTGAYDLDAYADEHALGEQRFFNLQCLIYGTDPEGFAGMVAAGDLTAARAAVCPRDTRSASRAWIRLLVPHLAPGYEVYGEEAQRFLDGKGWVGPGGHR